MATIQLDTGSGFPGSALVSEENALRRPLFPAIRWGAVLAGVAVGISVQLVLSLLGIASGLSITSVSAGEAPGTGALIWAGASMLISALVGAYVAGRLTGLKRKADGILHGVVAWAVTTLLLVLLATSAGGSLLSTMFSSVGQGANAVAQSSAGGISGFLGRQLGTSMSARSIQTLQDHIAAGRRDQAVDFLVSNLGMQRERASLVIDQALILSGSPEQASAQGRAAADHAISRASTVAWSVFAVVVLSLALSFLGGALGAMGARRTTWNDSAAAGIATASERTL